MAEYDASNVADSDAPHNTKDVGEEITMLQRYSQFAVQKVAPVLMMICTAFTMQCIGQSMLDSWRFARVVGGTVAMFGMFFPLVFVEQMGKRQIQIAMSASLVLSIFITTGRLCGCY